MDTEQQNQIVRTKLQEFMHEFDNENRGNRLSKMMLSSLGGFLENLIMEIVNEVNSVKSQTEQKEGK